jgi:two-component system, NtrC family, sensor histidine kinase GlrK
MTIKARLAISLFLITGILVGALAHQLAQVEKLQGINHEVSLIKVEAARISVRLLQGLEGVREFAAKWVLLGDPDYLPQWEAWEDAVEDDLRRLAAVGLSEPEEEIRRTMEELWTGYRRVAAGLAEDPGTYLPEVEGTLDALREQTAALITANEAGVAERAVASVAAAEDARRVAWIATGSAVLLAAILSLLLFLSISRPLRRLTRGTRELARGRFEHRLRPSGPTELQSLGRDFNRMAARLGELEGMKRDFLSHVSHELKTPLAAIQETIEIFLDGVPGPLTPKQARLMQLSRRSSQRLSSMISNLLEIARLEAEADAYHPDWHNLVEIVESVLEEAEPLAQERNLRLVLIADASDPCLVCDRGRMAEVVSNLVGNAVKFSPEGGEVLVTILEAEAGAPSVDSSFLLHVEDEGPGVPDPEKERIFEKFHQVSDSRSAPGHGVGLGLAIVRWIVEAHGGSVRVEDRPAGGACFRVAVPRMPRRWRGTVGPRPEPETGDDPRAEGRVATLSGSAVRPRVGAVLLLLAGFAAGGCFPFQSGASPEEVFPPPSPASGSSGSAASAASTMAEVAPTFDATAGVLLAVGWYLFSHGEYSEALSRFTEAGFRAGGASPTAREQALWGMVMVHLHPESPHRDYERARTALLELEAEFEGEPAAWQAALVRGLIEELAEVRSVAEEQEQVLRRLMDTVEALKRIDLNRRPAREARPDSVGTDLRLP